PHRSSLAQSCTKPLWRGRYSPHSVFYSPPLNTAYFLSTRLQNEMSLQIPLRLTHTLTHTYAPPPPHTTTPHPTHTPATPHTHPHPHTTPHGLSSSDVRSAPCSHD